MKKTKEQTVLKFEELPGVNSDRWMSTESLEGEVWKPVKGFEQYFMVSCYGRIKSVPRITRNYERIIKPFIGPRGYYEIHIFLNRQRIHKKVHRIVLESFVPNIDNKPSIDHIDTNKLNNCLTNLKWVTNKENSNNKATLERVIAALKRAHKINEKPVAQIDAKTGEVIALYESVKIAAKETGIRSNSISRVARHVVSYSKEGWLSRNLTAGGYKWEYVNNKTVPE